ncbi:MAG: 5-keto-4-deoxy-D-glucarate aldolase [Anaerolineales bacterium]|nr:5-keto-4-deoxy-D-glucarate aldolase [Anaerolineales bacterium]
MRDNLVKQALQRGEVVIGTMATEMRSPAIGLLFANAGFDFFFIDMEHGSYDIITVADLVKVARLAGICPIVRVPDPAYHLMSRPLDAGAQGLMIPRVETREVVEHIVRCVKYPPNGVRGCSISKGHNEYTGAPLAEFTQHANENVLVVLQIERRRAVEDIDELLSVPGVDVALIGPNDLAASLGTMDTQHPETEAAIQTVVDGAKRHGVAAGIHTRDVEVLRMWQERGMRMLTCSTDTDFIVQGARTAVKSLRR